MDGYILKNLELSFPRVYENVAEFGKKINCEYMILLKDGSHVMYDMIRNTVRILPDIDKMSKDECAKDFGIRLYKWMVHRRLTQSGLAAKTGIGQSVISNYISGGRMPTLYNLRKIARALNCSIDDLTYM